MTTDLRAFVGAGMQMPVDSRVSALAAALGEMANALSVLFYGSNLHRGDLDGVLDFYVLTTGSVEHGIWPTVSYREIVVDGTTLRAKIATMRLTTFARAAGDRRIDTTIWSRFTQPCALVWARDSAASDQTIDAVAAAAITAGRYAAALGPARGEAVDYWRGLFKATYTAELRVERHGRHDQLVARDRAYYETLLPLAWAAGGVPFNRHAGRMLVMLGAVERLRIRLAWRMRSLSGKPINIARLVRATLTFDGAARYGAWKIERHTGIRIKLTPWRERHPVLAAPGVLWKVWRQTAS